MNHFIPNRLKKEVAGTLEAVQAIQSITQALQKSEGIITPSV